jgi:SAM-dependent methyltransferase
VRDAESDARFLSWIDGLERRHLAEITFPEVRRALQALSALYVGRRERLARGGALDGAGKRAAFAAFYGPLHFLVVRHVIRQLGLADPTPSRILDLGCGTGAAGAAWAQEAGVDCGVRGVDLHPWAVREASWTYRTLGVRGRCVRGDVDRVEPAPADRGVVCAYVLNELPEPARDRVLERLLRAAARGVRVLVVEPIARRPVPWWSGWADRFVEAGGRDETWRFHEDLPDLVARLDRAARLDHSQLTARTLSVG